LLLQHNAYTLLDIMVHDSHKHLRDIEAAGHKRFWVNSSWSKFRPRYVYDVVVANDLFCNADQRLEMFLETFLPVARTIRLSLTYHNTPRHYEVKRVDAEEVLNIVAWDGQQVARVLKKFSRYIDEPTFSFLDRTKPSLFNNGRQVCSVTLSGTQA